VVVTPAQAGVQKGMQKLDSRLRGNDGVKTFSTSYEIIMIDPFVKSRNLASNKTWDQENS
jgi:hypothetical protein